jgi:hypothetical protein
VAGVSSSSPSTKGEAGRGWAGCQFPAEWHPCPLADRWTTLLGDSCRRRMSSGKENDMLLDYYQSHSLPKFCIPRMRSINVLTRLTRLRWAFLTSLVDTRSRVQGLSREGTPDSGALGRPPSGWFPASPRQRVLANKRTLGPAHPTGDQDISTDFARVSNSILDGDRIWIGSPTMYQQRWENDITFCIGRTPR